MSHPWQTMCLILLSVYLRRGRTERTKTVWLTYILCLCVLPLWWWKDFSLKGKKPTRLISRFQKFHCWADRAEGECKTDRHLLFTRSSERKSPHVVMMLMLANSMQIRWVILHMCNQCCHIHPFWHSNKGSVITLSQWAPPCGECEGSWDEFSETSAFVKYLWNILWFYLFGSHLLFTWNSLRQGHWPNSKTYTVWRGITNKKRLASVA